MTPKRILSLVVAILAVIGTLLFPDWSSSSKSNATNPPTATAAERDLDTTTPKTPTKSATKETFDASIGFTSKASLRDHFQKHGKEFGEITIDEYLERAQTLRDADIGPNVLEVTRADGVRTRFDRRSGAFLAFHADKSIRTFFVPNDGEDYFRRQADTDH